MVSNNVHKFPATDALEIALAQQIQELLTAAIDKQNQAVLAVSGGSTPLGLFKKLSVMDLAWDKVQVVLVDERLVAPASADSNTALVRQNLLTNNASAATFIDLTQAATTAAVDNLKLDVAVLGMGLDGHTASWFPCAKEINSIFDTQAPYLQVTPTTAKHERITLTPKVIMQAESLFLHIVGAEKFAVYEQALINKDHLAMPISFVLHEARTKLAVYWSN